LPRSTQLSSLIMDIRKASPDAILEWGRPGDTSYAELSHSLILNYPQNSSEKIVDPVLGEVGIVLFTEAQRTARREYVPAEVFTGEALGLQKCRVTASRSCAFPAVTQSCRRTHIGRNGSRSRLSQEYSIGHRRREVGRVATHPLSVIILSRHHSQQVQHNRSALIGSSE